MLTPTHPQWHSTADAALQVDNADDLSWQDEADVVVVGFGGAGVSAAIEAADCGASVIAVDRFHGGGATAISGGVCYMGGGTKQQQQAGYDDTPDEMYRYLQMETEGIVEDETLHRFCDTSSEMQRWLEENGIQFNGTMSPVKTSYPGKGYFLYFSGNEPVPEYAEKAKPAPRGHRAVGSGMSGKPFYEPLKKSALAKGIKLKAQSRGKRLVLDKEGAVIGLEIIHFPPELNITRLHKICSVIATNSRLFAPWLARFLSRKMDQMENSAGVRREFIRARKGVILATGGFIQNKGMVNSYAPKYNAGMPLGDTACDGSGIRLGQTAGGAVAHMDQVSAWRFINPPLEWAKGIVVNDEGERYCNEQVYGAKLGYHMVQENNGRARVIIDTKQMSAALKYCLSGKVWYFQALPAVATMLLNRKKGQTPEELARKCGMPETKLKATIENYNLAATGQQADPLGKADDFLEPLNSGPYYALDVSLDSLTLPCAVITFGGLVLEETTGLVKNESGQPIRGLYAAGRTAVGLASHFYVSGLSIADCVFSGRRAAHHCASSTTN